MHPITVFSEIGRLETVLLHRPGKELEHLVPDSLERLLFDDIPFLELAQAEHDAFAQTLRQASVKVLYLEDLVAEAIEHAGVKEGFIDDWLSEANISSASIKKELKAYLLSIPDTYQMVVKTMEGVKKKDWLHIQSSPSLSRLLDADYPFLVDPMPNLYFTRDPFTTVGHGITLNRMYAHTRNRETIYGRYIFTYHPKYGNGAVPIYYDPSEKTRIEGGDILVLSDQVLAIGISQRTDARSIDRLARNLFEQSSYKKVLAFLIDHKRKFMHLDTVFTMVDHHQFTIHPEIETDLKVFEISLNDRGQVSILEQQGKLNHILAAALDIDQVNLIRCGGEDKVAAAREQWSDGANTLAIAPGELVVYARNTVTNQLLEDAGIRLHRITGSELVRGRGGPRCMSMPLSRAKS